ncbi:O-antigen ligase family protein [Lysobacter sp. LF1]|uniref:O-antigen ligase family protein n=1 Tax=Lysobacter stagni TaxID=3045172 RepID=A0ABT6XDZ9_9GAMM|nr:O-antigen ligase family protein [Lysobacter sp. LF1]MDI9238371.1 O-antigen ligase family protein [Lysobacter sp. LF1]
MKWNPLSHPATDLAAGASTDAIGVWLRIGLLWLVIGMALMPAGPSLNPGKPYQYIVLLTLYVPALFALTRPGQAVAFWRQPLVPAVLALLAWGCLSLLWSQTHRYGDEIARNLSIAVFLYGWFRGTGNDEAVIERLLTTCAFALAAVAVVAIAWYQTHPNADARQAGFGVMSNANLAAAAMGAALLWLSVWRTPDRRMRVAKAAAWVVLAMFVLLTFTRSAWAAMFAALLTLALTRHRRPWRSGVIVIGVGVACGLLYLPSLIQRGWSLRPAIMQGAWDLFRAHPVIGLGQGSEFTIRAGKELLTHAHNLFSQLAVELGLVGLVLWSGIWLAVAWRGWVHRQQPIGRLVLATWVFAMIMVQFDLPHLLDSPRPGWLVLWLPIALGFALKRQDSPTGDDGSR